MKTTFIWACFFFNVSLYAQSNRVPLEVLQGSWYIQFTNFPMWLKGDKLNPAFNYTIKKKGKIEGLKDEVIYFKKGKQKSIVGFDKPTDTTNMNFVWRGQGLLSILKSNWQVLYIDPTNTWALISFKKTLFTPAGYDIISKNKQNSPDFEEVVKAKLKELTITETLYQIVQN